MHIHAHTCTHTYKRTHTNAHICAHRCAHAHPRTLILSCSHSCIPRLCVRAGIDTQSTARCNRPGKYKCIVAMVCSLCVAHVTSIRCVAVCRVFLGHSSLVSRSVHGLNRKHSFMWCVRTYSSRRNGTVQPHARSHPAEVKYFRVYAQTSVAGGRVVRLAIQSPTAYLPLFAFFPL